MDVEKTKKLRRSQIDAGQVTRKVRDVIKTDQVSEQDAYDTTAELVKPTIDVQKEVKKQLMKNKKN